MRWKLPQREKVFSLYDKSGKVAAAYEQFGKEVADIVGEAKRTKIELTAYDDLFETDQSREEAGLSKIRELTVSEIDAFPKPSV